MNGITVCPFVNVSESVGLFSVVRKASLVDIGRFILYNPCYPRCSAGILIFFLECARDLDKQ